MQHETTIVKGGYIRFWVYQALSCWEEGLFLCRLMMKDVTAIIPVMAKAPPTTISPPPPLAAFKVLLRFSLLAMPSLWGVSIFNYGLWLLLWLLRADKRVSTSTMAVDFLIFFNSEGWNLEETREVRKKVVYVKLWIARIRCFALLVTLWSSPPR